MKKIVCMLLASLILSSCASQKSNLQSNQHAKEQEILSYFEFSNIIYSEIESIAVRAAASDPEMGRYFSGQLKYFNKNEYNKNLIALINNRLTSQEADEIIGFIRSPQGKDAKVIFINIANPIAAEKHLASLSAERKIAIESFMRSSPGAKLGSLLSSTEFINLNKSYGELLGCRYFSENKSVELKALQEKGKCLDI